MPKNNKTKLKYIFQYTIICIKTVKSNAQSHTWNYDVSFHCEVTDCFRASVWVYRHRLTLSETLIVLAALVSLPVCRLLSFVPLSLTHTHTHTVRFCCWKDDSSEYAAASSSFCECLVSGCFLLILLILDCYRSLLVPLRALAVFILALVDYLSIVTFLDTPITLSHDCFSCFITTKTMNTINVLVFCNNWNSLFFISSVLIFML